MANNKQIAANVLEAVGGSDNVSFVAHCMTRLRFTLKDRSKRDDAKTKKIDGVLGAQESGGQYQVIIGNNVSKVYDELCSLGGLSKQASVHENLDADVEDSGIKNIGRRIMNYLAGAMTPMIPVMLAAGLFKTIGVVLGPSMTGVLPADDDLVILMDLIYNAAFYFMPIYLGFTAARQIGLTPTLGAFMGGLLIAPAFMQMATDGTEFSVFGIPCIPGNYAQTVLPILMSVWVMNILETFFRKHLPDALLTVFVPFLTLLFSIPLTLCLLAPIGGWLGNGIASAFTWLGEAGGLISILGGAAVSMLWLPLVVSGMHVALIGIAQVSFFASGVDSFMFVAVMVSLWAAFGVQLATLLKLKLPKERTAAAGYVVAQWLGGVGEPFMYGIMFRYPRTVVCSMIGAAVAGGTALALGTKAYVVGLPSSFMSILSFVGGGTENLIYAAIACSLGLLAGFFATFFFGYRKDEIELGPVSERV